MRNVWWLAMMAVITLLGCTEKKPPEKTVFDSQIQALEKARAVEQNVRQGAERQREAVKEAEQQSAPY